MTQIPTPTGFWSYTSSDDTASKGRLSMLRRLLADELQLQTGKTPKVHIFQDVAAIPHGSDWLKEIHKALDQSWFFIPIITPAFLQSEMCCEEVVRFREREAALGRNDLIFPFHYIGVDDIEAERPGDVYDPKVLDLLRSRQWIDFRRLRLRSHENEEVLELLDTFAASLRAALRRDIRAPVQRTVHSTLETAATFGGAAPDSADTKAAVPLHSRKNDPRVGSTLVRARDAAAAKKPVAEGVFPIELPGVSGWPRPEMIAIPPGRFLMGAPKREEGSRDSERPQHEVAISHAFALGKFTVTFAEWDAALAAGAKLQQPGDRGWGRDRRPVIEVSWHDAKAYLAWLNGKLGLTGQPGAYRLPSEAEWEYACRAGTLTPFGFGETISTDEANYDGNYTYGSGKKGEYRQRTMPVGSFPANLIGLHDMHGNVWEWCEDVWHDSYEGAPLDGSAWTVGGNSSYRVIRGGSWSNDPQYLRSARRDRDAPTDRNDSLGFRLARTL